MDDYFFRNHVKACRNVSEDTSYLEIFNYSVCDLSHKPPGWGGGGECFLRADQHQDPSYNTVEQHPLTMDEFDNFLKRKVHLHRCQSSSPLATVLSSSRPGIVISYQSVLTRRLTLTGRIHAAQD